MEKNPQACILTGGEDDALYARAVERAALCVCQRPAAGAPCGVCRDCRKTFAGIHPDVITVKRSSDKQGKLRQELVVSQIRALSADAPVLPNEAARKVYILREAERMNAATQNAFLKLLEEPPSFVVFLLCAENAALLLPTVRSRCVAERLGGPAAEPGGDGAAEKRAAEYLARLGQRSELLRWCAAQEKLDAAALRELVEAARLLAPERLTEPGALLPLERELARAAEYLRQNVSVKHVLSMLATVEMGSDL